MESRQPPRPRPELGGVPSAQHPAAASEKLRVQVTVPDGCQPGQAFNFTYKGRSFGACKIPMGWKPGKTIPVDIPAKQAAPQDRNRGTFPAPAFPTMKATVGATAGIGEACSTSLDCFLAGAQGRAGSTARPRPPPGGLAHRLAASGDGMEALPTESADSVQPVELLIPTRARFESAEGTHSGYITADNTYITWMYRRRSKGRFELDDESARPPVRVCAIADVIAIDSPYACAGATPPLSAVRIVSSDGRAFTLEAELPEAQSILSKILGCISNPIDPLDSYLPHALQIPSAELADSSDEEQAAKGGQEAELNSIVSVTTSTGEMIKVDLLIVPGTLVLVNGGDNEFRGEVMGTNEEKDSIIYYPSEKKAYAHDINRSTMIDSSGWAIKVVEPPVFMIAMIRFRAGCYQGLLTPTHGTIWTLTAEDVEAHFLERHEGDFLRNISSSFQHVPMAGRATAAKRTATPAKLPSCVLGGLSMALAHMGDAQAAAAARKSLPASLRPCVKDRLAHATQVLRSQCYGVAGGFEGVDIGQLGDSEHPILLHTKSDDDTVRTHAITVMRGLIFDSEQPRPLALTRANLDLSLGVPYGGIVRGYRFTPGRLAKKRLSRQRPLADVPLNSPKKPR